MPWSVSSTPFPAAVATYMLGCDDAVVVSLGVDRGAF